jgi:hypothetical protein
VDTQVNDKLFSGFNFSSYDFSVTQKPDTNNPDADQFWDQVIGVEANDVSIIISVH